LERLGRNEMALCANSPDDFHPGRVALAKINRTPPQHFFTISAQAKVPFRVLLLTQTLPLDQFKLRASLVGR
jgi:hypothetical protein